MLPVDCPAWDYKKVNSGYSALLKGRVVQLFRALAQGTLDTKGIATDSRPAHGTLFQDLTPPTHPYYAGNYRGCSSRCLTEYAVTIKSDPRVGSAPAVVTLEMDDLARTIAAGLQALDAANRLPNAQLSEADRLANAVTFVCRIFEQFLRIHPYADGNGHAGRVILTVMLFRYGYWLRGFPVEPRPPDPPYSECIKLSRDGDRAPLERFVMSCLMPRQPPRA